MIKIEVTGDNAGEVINGLFSLAGVFQRGLQQVSSPPTQPEQSPPPEPPKDESKSTKTRGKKAEPAPETPAADEKKEDAPAPEEPAPPKLDDIREKLKALASAKSPEACFELLKEYGVKKLSDVPKDKLPELVAKIDETLEGA